MFSSKCTCQELDLLFLRVDWYVCVYLAAHALMLLSEHIVFIIFISFYVYVVYS